MKINLISSIIAIMSLAACSDNTPHTQYQQPSNTQQPQVIVQQAPQESSSLMPLIAGAAIGAVAANMMNKSNSQPAPTQNITNVYKTQPVITQPVQPKSNFKPESLPAKKVEKIQPKSNFKPKQSYSQAKPSVSYSSSYKRK